MTNFHSRTFLFKEKLRICIIFNGYRYLPENCDISGEIPHLQELIHSEHRELALTNCKRSFQVLLLIFSPAHAPDVLVTKVFGIL